MAHSLNNQRLQQEATHYSVVIYFGGLHTEVSIVLGTGPENFKVTLARID